MNKLENCPFCSKKLEYKEVNNFSLWSTAICYNATCIDYEETHHIYSWSDFDKIQSLDYIYNGEMLVIQIWETQGIVQIIYGGNTHQLRTLSSINEIRSKMDDILLLS